MKLLLLISVLVAIYLFPKVEARNRAFERMTGLRFNTTSFLKKLLFLNENFPNRIENRLQNFKTKTVKMCRDQGNLNLESFRKKDSCYQLTELRINTAVNNLEITTSCDEEDRKSMRVLTANITALIESCRNFIAAIDGDIIECNHPKPKVFNTCLRKNMENRTNIYLELKERFERVITFKDDVLKESNGPKCSGRLVLDCLAKISELTKVSRTCSETGSVNSILETDSSHNLDHVKLLNIGKTRPPIQ